MIINLLAVYTAFVRLLFYSLLITRFHFLHYVNKLWSHPEHRVITAVIEYILPSAPNAIQPFGTMYSIGYYS